MLRHKLRFGRLAAVYLAVALLCLIVGSLSSDGRVTAIAFGAGEWLLGLFCPLVLLHYIACGLFRIE